MSGLLLVKRIYLIYIPFTFLESHPEEASGIFLDCSWYNTNNRYIHLYKYTMLHSYHHTYDI